MKQKSVKCPKNFNGWQIEGLPAFFFMISDNLLMIFEWLRFWIRLKCDTSILNSFRDAAMEEALAPMQAGPPPRKVCGWLRAGRRGHIPAAYIVLF